MSAPFLDQATLRSLLHYEPNTGTFTWLPRSNRRWNSRYAGKVAGFDWRVNSSTCYRSIRIFDWPFLAHRLAVLYMTGAWPQADTDHRDGNGLNNRWDNLRLASKAENGANRGANRNSKTGIKGVVRRGERYEANFRGRRLGLRDTPEEAAILYEEAIRAHFGEFARAS